MLKLRQEEVGGLVLYVVCEVVRGLPSGSWGKFTSEVVACNFMRSLQSHDTEGLIHRLICGLWSDDDRALYEHIISRVDHVTRVDTTHLTGGYWQRYYPHLAF